MDTIKLKEEQIKIAKKVVSSDDFDKIETVAGCDQAFTNDKIFSVIVVCDAKSLEVIEKSYHVMDVPMKYVPGYLAFRELPSSIEAFNKLENKPDVMIVAGNGILHPRRVGFASHLGILTDTPTIGIAKKQLCGEMRDGAIIVDKEVRANLIQTKEHGRPLIISLGHRISLQKSVELVKSLVKVPHKLPEPLHLAHRYASEIKEKN